MGLTCLKKNFFGIGKIEYRPASSRQELEQAFVLIYKEYLLRGFILPEYYKSGLRITLHNILPGTTTFVALLNKEVVATNTIIPDSGLGLPLDMGYKKEADKLRRDKRKICEAGYLAIKSELFGRGLFSMFNFNKLNFMFTLFNLIFQYALRIAKFDDICIVTNPQYMVFKFLPFEADGEVKYYGYDRASIKKKAAVLKRVDLKTVLQKETRQGIRNIFFASEIPQEIFLSKYSLNIDDLRYFFVEKSDILKNAKNSHKEYIRSCYGLSKAEFAAFLQHRKVSI